MKVTNVQVWAFGNNQGKLRGMARITLDDELQLTSLRIYEGSTGLFVSYPNDPYHKGEDYRQLFYPINKELRNHIEEEILKAYYDIVEGDEL